ncbi:MAG TPA: hypothetical protein VL025_20245, partial [Thermoanaerobaculia bacterium]|nr:hypothetical protein [Thermoanaerobaculia bacterium]
MSTPAAVAAPPPASLPHRLFPKLTLPIHRIEDGLAVAAILLMAVLPVLEIVLRSAFHTGIPGSTAVVQHLTLWVGFLGAMLASRE